MWNERFGEFDECTRYLNESEEGQELLVEPEGGEGVLTGERWRRVWWSISGTSQSVLFQPHSAVNVTVNPVTYFDCTPANIAVRTPPGIHRCLHDRFR